MGTHLLPSNVSCQPGSKQASTSRRHNKSEGIAKGGSDLPREWGWKLLKNWKGLCASSPVASNLQQDGEVKGRSECTPQSGGPHWMAVMDKFKLGSPLAQPAKQGHPSPQDTFIQAFLQPLCRAQPSQLWATAQKTLKSIKS